MKTHPWSQSDEARLIALRDQGKTTLEIAEAMGRTQSFIKRRAADLIGEGKIFRIHRGGASLSRWTDEELAILDANHTRSPAELQALLPNRSWSAIQEQSYRRKLRDRSRSAHSPIIVYPEELERPLGVPFLTASGVAAIRTVRGTVPHVPSIHGPLPASLLHAVSSPA